MADADDMRKRQQVLADFGEVALQSDDLDEVLTEACRLVGEALGTGRAKVLEIENGGTSLFVRAGVGWAPDVVGHLRMPMEQHSSETFSIRQGKPVVTQDISKEDRFGVPDFMTKAGVVAFVNTPIFVPGRKPFGLLQVDATEPREFGEDDIQFLRTYASILGPVIDRLLKLRELESGEERFRLIVETTRDYAIFLTDPEDKITAWFPGAEAVFGWTPEEAIGQASAFTYVPEDRQLGVPEREAETARREGKAPNVRWHLRKDGRRIFIEGSRTVLRDERGRVRGFLKIGQDVSERRRAEEALRESEQHSKVLLAELQHRVRNTLAVVRSVARRTAASRETVEDYSMHLEGRINAFARVQSAVTRDPEAGIDLELLVADELDAHGAREGEQVTHIGGPKLRLQPKAAERLGLAIHELTTNAVKYGALATEKGQIRVDWRIEKLDGQARLVFHWTESGVPLSGDTPTHKGFGTELIERTLAYDLDGQASLTFAPDGLHATISLPVNRIIMGAAAGRTLG